ncbi:MAG: iron-sulfur cluster assembly accessory protein [Nitrospirota bacterium]
MLTVTDKAAEKAKTVLAFEGKGDWGIKIYMVGEGCCGPSYGMNLQEEPLSNDEVIEKDGLKVFMDKKVFENLSAMQLDYYSDEVREGFVITGAVPSCGSTCGGCK